MATKKVKKVEKPEKVEIADGAVEEDGDLVLKDEPTKEPTMEVPVGTMAEVIESIEELKQSNAALRETVSKTRLEEAEAKQDSDQRPRVHFKIMDDQPIIGWPETIGEEKKSEIVINATNNQPVGEILKSVYYYLNGEKSALIDQVRFTRVTDMAYARVVEDLGDFGLLEFEDPKFATKEPVKIHKRFWNA